MLLGFVLLWVSSLCWLLATSTFALLQPRKRRSEMPPIPLPPVSIIVPTSSVDSARSTADRSRAIESLLELDPPCRDIVIAVDRGPADGELPERLRRAYRDDRLRIVVARDQRSANAKVDALAGGVAEARNDLLVFSDDDVVLDPHHLRRLLAQLRGDAGLVSAAAVGKEPRNLWGELELAFMNGQFARLHLAGDFLGWGGALGKSVLVRRADLARAGGLAPTGHDCCEDAALSANFAALGIRTVLGDRPVEQPIGDQCFAEVWRRHRRWLGCRRTYVPVVFLCEGLFSTMLACGAGATVFATLSLSPAVGAAVTALLWCTVDSLFIALKGWHFSSRTPLAWLIREVIFLPLWLSALFARTVSWYGRRVPIVAEVSR